MNNSIYEKMNFNRNIIISNIILSLPLLFLPMNAEAVCNISKCEKKILEKVKSDLKIFKNLNNVSSFSKGAFDSSHTAIANITDDIFQVAGLQANFKLMRTSLIENAAAVIISEESNSERYLLYNPSFIKQLDQSNIWEVYAIMAHEIGHHLQGHTLTTDDSKPPEELEADEYAGFILASLGATIDESLSLWRSLPAEGSMTHPPRAQRLGAVRRGWTKWRNIQKNMMAKARSLPSPSPQEAGVATTVTTTLSTETQLSNALPSASKKTFNQNLKNAYIIDDSHQNKTTLEYLEQRSKLELFIARNEIYARHGYIFKKKNLSKYFSSKEWYRPKKSKIRLNAVEVYNVKLIKRAERLVKEGHPDGGLKSPSDDSMLPVSSDRLLTSRDLKGLTKKQLRIARNEIYARHGYIFNSPDLVRHFNEKSWYHKKSRKVSLSFIEGKNVMMLRSRERRMKLK